MAKFVQIKTEKGWHFVLRDNDDALLGSSEVYTSEKACQNGIMSVFNNSLLAPVENQLEEGFVEEKNPKYVIFVGEGKKYRFRLTAPNGEIILASAPFKSLEECMLKVDVSRAAAALGYCEYESK